MAGFYCQCDFPTLHAKVHNNNLDADPMPAMMAPTEAFYPDREGGGGARPTVADDNDIARQGRGSLGARLRTLCHNRRSLHPPRNDPHHAKATCCKRLVLNPIFSDGLLVSEIRCLAPQEKAPAKKPGREVQGRSLERSLLDSL